MKVVSLFSGAGGLDLGFKKAGHEIIWANDLYKDAVDTYRENLGDHIVFEDITKIDADKIPDCDIVIGGFPCQGFSVANMKRTKGKVIEMIMDDFSSLGYKVKKKVLNAANYGVPQTRERVIIVGVRNDLDFDYNYPPETHNADGSNGLKKWVSVSEALSHLPDPDMPNTVFNHDYSKYKLKFNGYLGHRKLNPDKPAPTVTARGDDKGGVVILPHPNAERRMSCREVATVQSFPIDYKFMGNRSSVYRQIGNAVPPLLGYAVANVFNEYKE